MKNKKLDITRLVAPHLMSLIVDKKINVSNDLDTHLEVRDKLVKCLEKRKLDVIDAGIHHYEDEEVMKASNFLIEFIYKDKVVLLDGKIIDRYITERVV